MKKMKLKITFHKNSVTKPLIYELIKKYDIMFNILHADINYGSEGTLITEISGEDTNIKNALEFLDSLDVQYKLYEKSIIIDKNQCINCGACTAVCPSGSLSMNKNDELDFDKEKCLVCELCIPACPLQAISIEL